MDALGPSCAEGCGIVSERFSAYEHRFCAAEAPNAYPDGIASNFVFEGVEMARHAWALPGPEPILLP